MKSPCSTTPTWQYKNREFRSGLPERLIVDTEVRLYNYGAQTADVVLGTGNLWLTTQPKVLSAMYSGFKRPYIGW